MNRLGVVLVALGVLLAVAAAVVFWPGTPGEPGEVATKLADVESEGIIYLPDDEVYVISTTEGPLALSNDSRHLGDRVLYCAIDETFSAPHGELFDRLGRYLGGPAAGDLVRFPVRVDNGYVLVDISGDQSLPPRSEGIPVPNHPTTCSGPEEPAGFIQAGP